MVRFLISAAFEARRLLEKYGKKNVGKIHLIRRNRKPTFPQVRLKNFYKNKKIGLKFYRCPASNTEETAKFGEKMFVAKFFHYLSTGTKTFMQRVI